MGSGCAGPYKPGIVDSFRNQSFSGSIFNLGSATSRCKSWWFNGNRTQPSEFLSRIQKWEIYIAFFASKCVFFFAGGVYIGALRGSNEFFQVVDGIPTIFEESSQTWWNLLLGDIQKKIARGLFPFCCQGSINNRWSMGAPSICLYSSKEVSYLAKIKPTYFRLVSQPCFHGISTVNFEIEMLMGDLQLTVYIMMYVKISGHLYDRYEWYSIRIMYMYICIHILRSNKLRNLELSSQGILWNTLAVRVCESGPHW